MKIGKYKVLIIICGLLLLCLPITACKRRKAESFVCSTAGHTFGAWTEKAPSTCITAGVKIHTCSICGYEETQPLPLAEHSFKELPQSKPATCTTDGVDLRVCLNCRYEQKEIIPATGHSYGEWEEIIPVSCTSDGLNQSTCSVCSYKQTEKISATGHSFDENKECTVCSTNIYSFVLKFTLNGDGTSYSVVGLLDSTVNSITVPKAYRELPVTAIADSAFKDCTSLNSVIVPQEITSIGFGAFKGCESLESITLPFVGANIIKETGKTHFGYIFGADSIIKIRHVYPNR